MRAVEMLLEDHRDIERMLAVLAGAMTRLRNGESVDGQALKQIVEFLLEYADHYHHVREEQHIFPVLERYPLLTMAGRLDCMPGEHEIGRQVTTTLREATERYGSGDVSAASDFVDAAGKYLQLLAHHMGIEEGVLFELAEKVVSDEDDAAMAEGLAAAARAYQESGELVRMRRMLDDLQPLAPSASTPVG
jgi:hemerythrin-like domain-containing protein